MTVRHFFLGGHDLEMLEIRRLLERHAPGRFSDKGLGWGARASAYGAEIAAALRRGRRPVLVELIDDLAEAPPPGGIEAGDYDIVDHHGPLAGADRPTSLHQVFDLLHLDPARDWSRRMELVAANDRGWIPALAEAGATAAEIRAIRREDLRAQGVSEAEEAAARAAAAAAERFCGGRLTLVHLPHDRSSVLGDVMARELGGEGYENLLAACPGELAFYGAGSLVRALEAALPGGWYGGSLPERGFWGRRRSAEDLQIALDTLRRALTET